MHAAVRNTFHGWVYAVCYCVTLAVSVAPAEGEEPASPAPEGPSIRAASSREVREAATRAVRLVDRTSAGFLAAQTCFTCHTQTMSAMVLADARGVGVEIDEANFTRQYERAFEASGASRLDTIGYALWALDIGRHPPDERTEAMVEFLLNYQKELGAWKTTVDRPPAEASRFTTNYVALRGVNRYGTAKQKEAIAARAAAVKAWVVTADAADTEDQVFRLLLARELTLPRDELDRFVRRLLSEQQAGGGGWAQKAGMKPDAYATGSVLVALHKAGGVSCRDPAWLRGLGFLLETQKPDGSWHVVSRAKRFSRTSRAASRTGGTSSFPPLPRGGPPRRC